MSISCNIISILYIYVTKQQAFSLSKKFLLFLNMNIASVLKNEMEMEWKYMMQQFQIKKKSQNKSIGSGLDHWFVFLAANHIFAPEFFRIGMSEG